MAKGIDKIKYISGDIFAKMSVPGTRLTIPPDKTIGFQVEWESGATPADMMQPITWFVRSTDKIDHVSSDTLSSHQIFGFKIPKILCGSYHYFIDANILGVPNSNSKGIFVKGYCPPRIKKSKWSIINDGEDVRKTHQFCYGDEIHLSIETEGMNGDRVYITLYRRVRKGGGVSDDQHIMTYTDGLVIDGEINVSFGNTYQWLGIIKQANAVEEFYIKVKSLDGKFITDGKDNVHARYLRIKNKITNTREKPSTNNTPVKIGDTEKSGERMSLAAVYFRPLDNWNGEFGFDWLREKDNGLAPANDPAYTDIIEGGYLDGITDLTGGATGTAYAKLKNQYQRLPVSNTGYAVTEYFAPYLTLFSKSFVDTLPATLSIKPKYEADLKVLVAINGPIDRLEFEYDKNLLTVSPEILSDKAKTNSLVPSADTSIKITCKKDLTSDKEIKIYVYPTNGKPRSLAGKIMVLKNDAAARKKQKFVLVGVTTNINGIRNVTGGFSPSEQKYLQEGLYQSIILGSLEMGPILDLSGDVKFQLITDAHGNKTYGDFIYRNTAHNPQQTDGNIYEDHPNIFTYVQNLFLRLNPQYRGYYTMFSFNENTYDSFFDPSTGSAGAVPGQVQDIKLKNVFLFNGIQGATRGRDTIVHEGLHGLGLHHTHSDSTPISEPERKFVFANGNNFPAKSTDNIMSYGQKIKKSTWQWQWDIVRRNV
jgi:hypothetical protein